jgi:hypothetical protein
MTMFLEELKAQFSDVLRPNLYHVHIKPAWASTNIVDFGYLAQSATFPFVTFNTQQVMYNNISQYFVNGYDYDPVSFDFLLDADNRVIKFFDEWMQRIRNKGDASSINNNIGSTISSVAAGKGTFNYRDEYAGEVQVAILNPRQFEVLKVNLLFAFPVNIDNLALAYATSDSTLSLPVSFRFTEATYQFDEGLSVSGVVADIFDAAEKLTNPLADSLAAALKKNLPDSTEANAEGFKKIASGGNKSSPSSGFGFGKLADGLVSKAGSAFKKLGQGKAFRLG